MPRPPLVFGLTEPEHSSMHQLVLSRLRTDDRHTDDQPPRSRPMPSSRRLVTDIVKMLELLIQLDPKLAHRASRAIDALTDDTTPVRYTDRPNRGGRIKTPV